MRAIVAMLVLLMLAHGCTLSRKLHAAQLAQQPAQANEVRQ